MDHVTQVSLTKQMLSHIDAGTTCLAPDVATNPVATYASETLLREEMESLFRHYPVMMGLSCQLPEPGSYLTDDNTGLPILVVRTESGEVKAFLNVCRHRGSKVATGCGRVERRFVCPYHGWTYDCDGRLIGIPDARSFEGIERDGLVALPTCERYGFVWVLPTPDRGLDLDQHLTGLGPELGSYGFDSYHFYDSRTLHHRMNWKVAIDTFLEPYHFSVLHPDTVAPIFLPNLCLFEPFGLNLREVFPRRSIVEVRDQPEDDWDFVKHTAIVYTLFPNTVLVMQSDHLEAWRIFPVDERVDKCVLYLDFFTPEPAQTDSARRHWDRNMDLTIRTVEEEDFPTGEAIQFGFRSGAQDQIRYGRNEPALQHWQKSVATALARARSG